MKRFELGNMPLAPRLAVLALWFVITAATAGAAETNPAKPDGSADLKLSQVTLFSSGVGYFQRQATVNGEAAADLKFRAEQINDILKSLVIQDLDGGAIDVVTYTAKDPLERTLQSFGVKVTGKETLAELLDSLRGEPIRIAGPREMTGTILGIEQHKTVVGETTVETDMLNVLTDSGMQQLRLADLQGVELLDPKTSSELKKALAALASSHDAGKKSLVIKFTGEGQRRVQASFLLETPIWKTSYRLVLAPDKKPFLQGWAMVENTTDEDWKDVNLSLVSGRPISFVMDLYTPIYLRRPVEDLDLYASLRAPEFSAGYGGWGGMGGGGENAPVPAARMAPPAPAREDAVADKSRAAAPILARSAGRPAAEGRERAYLFADMALADGVQSVAAAKEAGELFEYTIEAPVSINRQQSAMLPIVNGEVTGEKLSIFDPASHPKHPLNGLKLKNATTLNLMQGPVTIFDGNTYGGDAKLPDLKPGEERLVAYALDLGTEVNTESKPCPTYIISMRIEKGTLVRQNKAADEKVYKLRNKQAKEKTVLVEQAADSSWKLVEPAEPYERTEKAMRFKVTVPANGTASLTVKTERIYGETIVLSEIDLKSVDWYITNLGGEVLSPAVREALQKVVAMRTELDRLARQRAANEQSLKESAEEQERIRKNLQVLQHNTDSYSRQLTKLDKLETQIETLREQVADIRKQEENQRTALETYLVNLTVDGK